MLPRSEPVLIPPDFSAAEANTFLEMFVRARDAQPGTIPSFRELFSGEGTLTTVMNRIASFLEVLLPKGTPGLGGSVGERLKLLFEERAGDGLRPTAVGKMIADRLDRFARFLADLGADTKRLAFGLEPNVVRIGAPQTLTLRLLAYAFSNPDVVKDLGHSAPDTAQPRGPTLKVSISPTRELLTQLKLGGLDAVISYGYRPAEIEKGRFVYCEPDLGGVNFAGLGHAIGMKLICHPSDPVKRSGGRAVFEAESIDPMQLDLRSTTLISVPSWQQGQATQDLITRAKDVGRHREVTTYDEVLALVRCGGCFGLVPAFFSDRSGVLHCNLKPSRNYDRELGVYFRSDPTLENGLRVPVEACMYLEFLAVYLGQLKPLRPPVYRPVADANDPDTQAAHEKYLTIVAEYHRRFGDLTHEGWVEVSRTRYPAAAPLYPKGTPLAVGGDSPASPPAPEKGARGKRR